MREMSGALLVNSPCVMVAMHPSVSESAPIDEFTKRVSDSTQSSPLRCTNDPLHSHRDTVERVEREERERVSAWWSANGDSCEVVKWL